MPHPSATPSPVLPPLGQLFSSGAQVLRPSQDRTATVSVSGDISAIRGVETALLKHGDKALAGIAELLDADWVLGNLETSITEGLPLDPIRGAFTSRPDLTRYLLNLGFHSFNLANNHTMDCGPAGLNQTRDYLQQHAISFVGAGDNLAAATAPLIREVNGIRFGLLAFSQPELDAAGPQTAGVAPLRRQQVLDAVGKLRSKVDVLILSLHEGYEFQFYPRLDFIHFCRELIDLGVDLIWGNHPHVIQGMETRGQGLILYSMGNFLFDLDYQRQMPGTRDGLIAHVTFDRNGPCALRLVSATLDRESNLSPASPADQQRILSSLATVSATLDDLDQIRQHNLASVQSVFAQVLTAPYTFGTDNQQAALDHFIHHQCKRDPYLKVFRDFGELVGSYTPLSSRSTLSND